MKKLKVNLVISKGIFIIILVCNLVLPLTGNIMQLNLFQSILCIIWVYGLLSHLGYFKTQVSDGSDGVIRYEPNTPIVQVGLLRLAEFIYYFLIRKSVINWTIFIGLIVGDVIYIMFLLLDKANYVFEMEDEDGLD